MMLDKECRLSSLQEGIKPSLSRVGDRSADDSTATATSPGEISDWKQPLHNGAQQIIVSSQRDGFHPRAVWTWRETGLNSYVELSAAAATEPDSSSSIMEEGKQPRPFSICANVREKDRSQELTAAEVEEAEKPPPEEIDGLVVPGAGFSSTERKINVKLRAQSYTVMATVRKL
ncbi:Hypothetical predicted protein [Xyrichtys novacula]|uniref:Uncharacterized protein n=1 Tax=Xyrichtys novacula TaxID=13765 RepID=A0AAV1FFR1_XYRNO|nr:Hypothetical predicted protein [Xyrichtys novacula]